MLEEFGSKVEEESSLPHQMQMELEDTVNVGPNDGLQGPDPLPPTTAVQSGVYMGMGILNESDLPLGPRSDVGAGPSSSVAVAEQDEIMDLDTHVQEDHSVPAWLKPQRLLVEDVYAALCDPCDHSAEEQNEHNISLKEPTVDPEPMEEVEEIAVNSSVGGAAFGIGIGGLEDGAETAQSALPGPVCVEEEIDSERLLRRLAVRDTVQADYKIFPPRQYLWGYWGQYSARGFLFRILDRQRTWRFSKFFGEDTDTQPGRVLWFFPTMTWLHILSLLPWSSVRYPANSSKPNSSNGELVESKLVERLTRRMRNISRKSAALLALASNCTR